MNKAPDLPKLPPELDGYKVRRDQQSTHVAVITDFNRRLVGYWSLSKKGDDKVWNWRQSFRYYCVEVEGRLLAISAEIESGPEFIAKIKGPGLCALMDLLECWDEADLPDEARKKIDEFETFAELLRKYAGTLR